MSLSRASRSLRRGRPLLPGGARSGAPPLDAIQGIQAAVHQPGSVADAHRVAVLLVVETEVLRLAEEEHLGMGVVGDAQLEPGGQGVLGMASMTLPARQKTVLAPPRSRVRPGGPQQGACLGEAGGQWHVAIGFRSLHTAADVSPLLE